MTTLLTIATAISTACMSPGEPQRGVTMLPISIDRTGRSDVTSALNEYFAQLPDSSVVHFAIDAHYRVEGTLLLVNRRALTIEGNGATVFATTDGSGVTPPPGGLGHLWPRGRRHFLIRGGEGIVVRNLTVRGANPKAGTGDSAYVVALEAQHGFEFSGVKGGELDRVTVTDVYGDFVYFGAYAGKLSSDIRVHHSSFARSGRQGMAFTGAQDVLIELNEMTDVRRAHFDLEPNLVTDVVRGITISNNRFGVGRLLFLASGGAGGTIEDVTVSGNILRGKPLNIQVKPPVGSRRSGFRILNNVSDATFGSPAPLMQFARIDGLEVRGNHNPLQAGRSMVGVGVTESCGVLVQSNDFPGGTELSLDSTVCP